MSNEQKEGRYNIDEIEATPEERIDFSKVKRFRMEAGQSYRIHFIENSVDCVKRHYLPKVGNNKGGYFRCTISTGFCPVCFVASNLSKDEREARKLTFIKRSSDYFTNSIIVYGTDKNGTLLKAKSAEAMLFGFGSEKLLGLKEIINEYGPLDKLDLGLTCTDAGFQKFTIIPKKDCAYLTDPDYKRIIDEIIAGGLPSASKLAAREVSVFELAKKFNIPKDLLPEDVMDEIYPEAARDSEPEEVPDREDISDIGGDNGDIFADINNLGAIL